MRGLAGSPLRRPGPGTPVTVVGLARSGAAAASWLVRLGCLIRVTEQASDAALTERARKLAAVGVEVELGRHTQEFVRGSHLVVTSPGVGPQAGPLRWARERGIPVVSELELGSWFCPGKIIAVTGSNGKSTVATLVGEILKGAGKPVVVCGNIGQPLTDLLLAIQPQTLVVLEVSSFQLEHNLSFHSEIACILNVTTNHLDHHGSFAQYRAAKGKLLIHQKRGSWTVLNADDPVSYGYRRQVQGQLALFSRRREVPGACLKGQEFWLNLPAQAGAICRRQELPQSGGHHEANALAAASICGILGVSPEAIGRTLRSFRGLPHRQEVVATFRGVTFVNDSKSTTVASGLCAIAAAPGPVVLIAGGRDKGSDFTSLRSAKRKLKGVVVIGEDGPKIAQSLKGLVPLVGARNLPEAVRRASQMAGQGDWVLLSPMCTSFDMFRDFEDRGEQFAQVVREIAS